MDNNEILLKTLQKENELIKQNCKKMNFAKFTSICCYTKRNTTKTRFNFIFKKL